MKRCIKILSLMLTVTLCAMLCSCRVFTDISEAMYNIFYSEETLLEMSKADEFVRGFFSAVSDGNIAEAATYMHPQFFKYNDSLKSYLSKLEESERVDFSQGISIDYTRSKSVFSGYQLYDGYHYDGYLISYSLHIGSKSLICEVEVCENDDGYGVYGIKLENNSYKVTITWR